MKRKNRFAAVSLIWLSAVMAGCLPAREPDLPETAADSGAPEAAEEVTEPADALFSCTGGWEAEDHTVWLFDEDGSGEEIISVIRGRGEFEKTEPYSKKDFTWEEDSEGAVLMTDNGESEYIKKIEDGLEILVSEGTELYRISGRDGSHQAVAGQFRDQRVISVRKNNA